MLNNFKIDPSRTILLRKNITADARRRFNLIATKVKLLIIVDDALGLDDDDLLFNTENWKLRTAPEKVRAFKIWLQKLIDDDILVRDWSGRPWTAAYIKSAYKKGRLRAYTDAKKVLGEVLETNKEQYISSVMSDTVTLQKIELLSDKAFTDFEGVTAVMTAAMLGIVSQGLANNSSTNLIASQLTGNVARLINTRTNVIAQDEVMRAFTEGQLDGFEDLGVEELKLVAEWSTVGDDKVCSMCSPLEGTIMTIDEARGLLPRHNNCRCIWIPAEAGVKRVGQLWDSKRTLAIKKSIRGKSTVWAGKVLV